MSKDVIELYWLWVAGLPECNPLWIWPTLAITFIFLKNPRPSEGLCRNWTKPFPPMTALCELSHPNWSRSAGT